MAVNGDRARPFEEQGVRYQTRDVNRAVTFYTEQLGCELKHQQGGAFAALSCGGLDLLLSGAESSGAVELFEPARRS